MEHIKKAIALTLVLGMVLEYTLGEVYARDIYNGVDKTININTDVGSNYANNNIDLNYMETDSWNNFVNSNVTLKDGLINYYGIYSILETRYNDYRITKVL